MAPQLYLIPLALYDFRYLVERRLHKINPRLLCGDFQEKTSRATSNRFVSTRPYCSTARFSTST